MFAVVRVMGLLYGAWPTDPLVVASVAGIWCTAVLVMTLIPHGAASLNPGDGH